MLREGLHASACGLQWILSGYSLAFGLVLVPAGRLGDARSRQTLDPVGVVILGAGVTALLLPLVQDRQWPSPLKWLLVPAALAVLAEFVCWERRYRRRGGDPVVDLTLFRRGSCTRGCALAVLYFAGFTAIFFTLTPYLQSHLRESALVAGASITPFTLGSAVSAPVAGRLVNRFGRRLVAGGLVLVTVGLGGVYAATQFLPGPAVSLALAAPLLVAGAGGGAVISPNQTLTLSEVPSREGGSAAGVLQTGQRVASAIGVATVGAVFFATLAAAGDWTAAFHRGLLILLEFVLASLVLAIASARYR